MIYAQVIIVGGGPAGSSCAGKLREHGRDCLVLDKQEFPRPKLCAGWITPQVLSSLNCKVSDYPHALTIYDRFRIHLHGRELKVPVRQFAVRRVEFDDWLLRRSGATVAVHEVNEIVKDGDYYVIDAQYCCRYLVGAGGTWCPVFRTFFRPVAPRSEHLQIIALEAEFPYEYKDANCHLWLGQNRLPGYAWYVPKRDGYVNIGIGGYAKKLKANDDSIHRHWLLFRDELQQLGLVENSPAAARGNIYYIRDRVTRVQKERIFLTGDAAGLATRDMGEGIGPAILSGILAAEAIVSGKLLTFRLIKNKSFPAFSTSLRLLASLMRAHLIHALLLVALPNLR